MKKFFLLWFTLCCFNLTAFAANKTISFAMEATYPPFEFINSDGQIEGFDVDIANALCQQLQAQCTFSHQSFNSLIPSLQLGKFDAVISALSITPERAQQVSFTQSYYQPSGSFVGLIAKHFTLNNLAGKTIGAQQGSTFEKYLTEKYNKQITLKTYASIQDAFLDLMAGRIDLVLADTPIAQTWILQANNSTQFQIVGHPIIDATYFGSGYGIAVSKDNPTLLNELNAALTTIKANGTYKKITSKYFGA